METTEKGLYDRYNVTKKIGYNDPKAEYFVMRLDEHGDDINHINACRKAMLTYANEIAEHLPKLSEDILKKYSDA